MKRHDLPIGDYALLSDCRSAALVSTGGSVDWLCFPRFDGPSVFARLLDATAGHWSIRPVGEFRPTVPTSRTPWCSRPCFTRRPGGHRGRCAGRRSQRSGPRARGRREQRPVAPGQRRRRRGRARAQFAPRPEYGLIQPVLEAVEGGIRTRGGANVLALSSPVPLDVDEFTASARLVVRPGHSVAFALQHRTTSEEQPRLWTEHEITERLEDTAEAWRTWSALHQSYDGPWRDAVQASGRVLYALTYFPTGAIVAAPTTSLPETAGGSRNWDYRYAWVATPVSPSRPFGWRHVRTRPTSSSITCPVRPPPRPDEVPTCRHVRRGQRADLTERELPHLAGWRGSAPVRVGNGAWSQRQLDVYGELLDAASRLPDQLDHLGSATKQFLADLADTAAARWREKDQGIWRCAASLGDSSIPSSCAG